MRGIGTIGRLTPGMGRMRAGGATFSPIITPVYGANLVPNWNMETGSPPTGWSVGSSAELTAQADEHTGGAGAQCLQVKHNGGNNPFALSGSIAVTAGGWYRFASWIKNIDASSSGCGARKRSDGVAFVALPIYSGTSWALKFATGHCTSSTTAADIGLFAVTSTLGRACRFDDVYLQAINGYFGSSRFVSPNGNVIVATKIKVIASTQIGFWLNVDNPNSPQNGVAVYTDGAKVYVEELLAGVWQTAALSASSAWTDWDELKVVKTNNTYQIYKNNIQVGTDLTISDAGVVNNTNHVQFSTYEGNQFQTFRVSPNP